MIKVQVGFEGITSYGNYFPHLNNKLEKENTQNGEKKAKGAWDKEPHTWFTRPMCMRHRVFAPCQMPCASHTAPRAPHMLFQKNNFLFFPY